MESRMKDNKLKENKLAADLKTIKECEADSWNYENEEANDFEVNFNHLQLRSHEDPCPQFEPNETNDNNLAPRGPHHCPQNLFGSRTYTSPASFDSSSLNSNPFKNEIRKSSHLKSAARKFANSKQNSIVTKLRNEINFDNIEDPKIRQMLIDFLDQSTIKTEYVTMKESSSSGEEVKGLRKIQNIPKRRHKSPLSVLPNHGLARRGWNGNSFSQERKRFTLGKQTVKTVADPEQQMHNFVIERKHGSDDQDSKNGDKCLTEESREVPLEAILNRLPNYHPFNQQRSRAQSGYSASRDEATHPGERTPEIDWNFDQEVVVDLEDVKRHHNKESIFFANEPVENEKNTVQMANMTRLKQFVKKFRSILLIFLVLCLLAVLGRNIYLEVKVHEYPDEIFSLNKEINELRKYNADLEQKYNQCAYGNDEGSFYGYGTGPQDEEFDERSTFLGVSP